MTVSSGNLADHNLYIVRSSREFDSSQVFDPFMMASVAESVRT